MPLKQSTLDFDQPEEQPQQSIPPAVDVKLEEPVVPEVIDLDTNFIAP